MGTSLKCLFTGSSGFRTEETTKLEFLQQCGCQRISQNTRQTSRPSFLSQLSRERRRYFCPRQRKCTNVITSGESTSPLTCLVCGHWGTCHPPTFCLLCMIYGMQKNESHYYRGNVQNEHNEITSLQARSGSFKSITNTICIWTDIPLKSSIIRTTNCLLSVISSCRIIFSCRYSNS